jgi:hypothetical protein
MFWGDFAPTIAAGVASVDEYGDAGVASVDEYGDAGVVSVSEEYGDAGAASVLEYGDAGVASVDEYGDAGVASVDEYGDAGAASVDEYGDAGVASVLEYGDAGVAGVASVLEYGDVTGGDCAPPYPPITADGAASADEYGDVSVDDAVDNGGVMLKDDTVGAVGAVDAVDAAGVGGTNGDVLNDEVGGVYENALELVEVAGATVGNAALDVVAGDGMALLDVIGNVALLTAVDAAELNGGVYSDADDDGDDVVGSVEFGGSTVAAVVLAIVVAAGVLYKLDGSYVLLLLFIEADAVAVVSLGSDDSAVVLLGSDDSGVVILVIAFNPTFLAIVLISVSDKFFLAFVELAIFAAAFVVDVVLFSIFCNMLSNSVSISPPSVLLRSPSASASASASLSASGILVSISSG